MTSLQKLMRDSKYWVGLFVILFAVGGILTLHNYGLTFDEGLGNLFFGERYLHYFTSFNQKYLIFNADLDSLSHYPLHLYQSPFRDRPNEFPPLADTLSAASMYLFSYDLKWLNPIDGFHLFTIILAAVFLWVMYRFAEPRIGKFAALMALLFLATFPRFWADMHFNVKDVPEAIFIGLVLMSYWSWFEKPSASKALRTGILMGCALSIKANAIFIIPILIIAIFPWSLRLEEVKSRLTHIKQYLLHYGLMGTFSVAVYILSWPYLYTDTITHIKRYWMYIYTQGGRSVSNQWSIIPLREVVTSMPEIMLLAAVIGIAILIIQAWKDKSPIWRLLIAWALFPILRASIPGAINFDGIRHFLEFVPAAALIAGFGVSRLVQILTKNRIHLTQAMRAGVLLLLMVNLVQINLTFYPYLDIYYNTFVGGLAGARDKYLGGEATDYWAASYRQGMEWMNNNAPSDASITALIAPWIIDISGPVFLRPDIKIISQLPYFNVMNQSIDPYYLMFITRAGFYQDEINYVIKHGTLVYQVVVDHVPILVIYQMGGSGNTSKQR